MSVRGDFKRLRALTGGLEKLARREFLKGVVRKMGAEALTLAQEGFEKAEAPDGTPWRPLLGREGRPLRNTGRLFNSMSFRSSSASFSLIATANYAGFQNAGTRRIPARPFFPQGGLPPKWEAELAAVAREALLETVPS
jgi:phage gpG-like protein